MSLKMSMRKGEASLDGYGTRKAFYGKAGVRLINGVLILRSYDTDYYAAAYNGRLFLLCERFSSTSATHLAAFARYTQTIYNGKRGNGKRDPFSFDNLPRARVPYGARAPHADAEVAGAVIAAYNAMTTGEGARVA